MFWSKSESLRAHLIMIVYDGPPLVFDWKGSPEFVPAQISFYLSRKAPAIKAIKKAGSRNLRSPALAVRVHLAPVPQLANSWVALRSSPSVVLREGVTDRTLRDKTR